MSFGIRQRRCRRRDGDEDVVDGALETLMTSWMARRHGRASATVCMSVTERTKGLCRLHNCATVVTVVVIVVSVAAVAAGRRRRLHDVFRRLG